MQKHKLITYGKLFLRDFNISGFVGFVELRNFTAALEDSEESTR